MKEPVHHHEQDGDGEQAGFGLEVKAAAADRVGDRDRDEPGDDRGSEGHASSGGERAPVAEVGTAHARGEHGEHENRLQAFAQHENAAVDHDGGG